MIEEITSEGWNVVFGAVMVDGQAQCQIFSGNMKYAATGADNEAALTAAYEEWQGRE